MSVVARSWSRPRLWRTWSKNHEDGKNGDVGEADEFLESVNVVETAPIGCRDAVDTRAARI